jgi:hypothetical protein
MEAQKKQVAELASQVTIPDEWRDTKASLIEEKLRAFNLESKPSWVKWLRCRF